MCVVCVLGVVVGEEQGAGGGGREGPERQQSHLTRRANGGSSVLGKLVLKYNTIALPQTTSSHITACLLQLDDY